MVMQQLASIIDDDDTKNKSCTTFIHCLQIWEVIRADFLITH